MRVSLATLTIVLGVSSTCQLAATRLAAQDASGGGVLVTSGPRTPEEERRAFHLPPGFEVQLVACEPVIQKPLNLAFDDRGRLWVSGTVEYPFPAEPGQKARDTVKVLEDIGSDGRSAEDHDVQADGLNIPTGVLPLPSSRSGAGVPAFRRSCG